MPFTAKITVLTRFFSSFFSHLEKPKRGGKNELSKYHLHAVFNLWSNRITFLNKVKYTKKG